MFLVIFLTLIWWNGVMSTAQFVNNWPTCENIKNAQSIMSKKDSRDMDIFSLPWFYYSKESSRYFFVDTFGECCKSELNFRRIKGIMATPQIAIRYYRSIHNGDPTGTHEIPFYIFNPSRREFELGLWGSATAENKDMYVVFSSGNVPFLTNYADYQKYGTNARTMAPWFDPTLYDELSKSTLYDQSPNYYHYGFLRYMYQTAMAPNCACGFRGYVDIRESPGSCTYGECTNGFGAAYKCVDIDECKEAPGACYTKENSHCVNTEGSFECICDTGYYSKGSECIEVFEEIDTDVQQTTSTSVTFKVAASVKLPEYSWGFSYNITDLSNPTNPLPVYGATQIHASRSQAQSKLSFSGLLPGTDYKITWDVYDDDNKKMTDIYGFTSGKKFRTLCTCGLSTDAPVLGEDSIVQKRGYVYFKFQGNSMCGNAYTFSRQYVGADGELSRKTIFTPNYFYTGNDCSPIPYEPGKASADVLAESKLIVGQKYRYYLRAVGNKYLGDENSKDFVVRWESSISGFVGLKPDYGSLPVENVTVRWALKNETGDSVVTGITTTSKSGRFEIHALELIPFENDVDYPMHITFEKTTKLNETYQIQHQFLCNNGRANCTDTGVVVHLKHLDFDVPLNVIDATSVPVSGKVYIAGTRENPDLTRWGSDGCPIQKVRVCLTDRSPGAEDHELICTDTAGDGTYSLPGTIGSRVSITASYYNHTFHYLPGEYSPNFENGIVLQPGQVYEQNDFEDRTFVPLEITVAGGICDLFLGTATISYRISGCLWGGAVVEQSSLSHVYNRIPAHKLLIAVDGIEKRADIEFLPRNLDLTQDASMNVQQSADEPLGNQNITEVRFQFDGQAKIRVKFTGDINRGCDSINDVKADSVHVLPFQSLSTATFFIERDLGEGLVCDAVDPDSRVTIQNNLGLLADDPSDDDYAVAIAESSPKEVLQMLYHCNQGCSVNITQDYNENLKRNAQARVEFPFMTGRPSIIEPFVKNLIIRTEEVKSVSYTAAVVIVGQYKKGDMYSVGLPTYEPILIIRDPPGGGSYAFYENVQTTIRMRNYKYTEYKGWDSNDKALLGAKGKFSQCAGLGYLACSSVWEMKDVAGYHFVGSKLDLDVLNQHAESRTLTTTWSYKTPSSNPLFTGNITDTFVVPNLNVKFSMIDTVSWNQSDCAASIFEETAFNLQSPENVPALAFVTAFEVINTEIPYLELNIESKKTDIGKATSDSVRKQLEAELQSLEDGVQGWRDALAKNEEIKRMVIGGNRTYQVKPHEWFDKIVNPGIESENIEAMKNGEFEKLFDTSDMSHNSAFLSEGLMSRAKLRPFYENSDSSITDLESTNTIKFSGGGVEFSFRLSQAQMASRVKDLGSKKFNQYHGGIVQLENTFVVVHTQAETDSGEKSEQVWERTETNDKQAATAIGFVLSDPDAGDQFDVDVYVDPVYGTFVFHTRSGKSICKHEPGTENRANPKLELVALPPPIVLEDDVMVFHVQISKMGAGSQGFTLSSELRDDVDALHHHPFLPRAYPIIENEESFVTTITLRRGPEKYEYPAYTLLLQPSCEFLSIPLLGDDATIAKLELYNQIDPVDGSRKIVFARPCSPIVLQGDIAKTQTFSITSNNPDASVKVVVQNPNSALMKWANATRDPETRLEQVQLFFRRAGTVQWQVGQYSRDDDTLEDIDFAAPLLEDAYGFVKSAWAVSHLADGEYEMQVRTVCDDISNAPAIFNGQDTEIIRGVLDRKPPKLYGLPKPQGKLPVGQSILFEFDETLDCTLPLKFLVDLRVSGIERVFDNDNLLLVCEDRTISVQFDRTNTDLNDLIGHNLTLVLSDVLDKNRNILKSKVSYDVDIVESLSECERRQLDEEKIPAVTADLHQDLLEEMRQLGMQQLQEIQRIAANQRQALREEMQQIAAELTANMLKMREIDSVSHHNMETEGIASSDRKLRLSPRIL